LAVVLLAMASLAAGWQAQARILRAWVSVPFRKLVGEQASLALEVLAPKVLAPKVLAPKVLAPKVLVPEVLAPKVLARRSLVPLPSRT
jgi:hypothetical protein